MPPSTEALQDLVALAQALGLAAPPPPDGANGAAAAAAGSGDAAGAAQPRQQQRQQALPGSRPLAADDEPSAAAVALATADAAAQLSRARLEALAAERAALCGDLADPSIGARRAAALASHAGALRAAAASRLALAERLRASKLRPGIVVAPERQPEFSAVLAAAAGGGPALAHGAGALAWAAALSAPPSCWEDALRGIPEGARACRQHLAALSEFGRGLDEAAAAAGGGGGGGGGLGGGGVGGTVPLGGGV